LQFVPSLDLLSIKRLLPFVTVADIEKDDNIKFANMLKYGRSDLFIRHQRLLQEKAGYLPIADSILELNPDKSRYLGSPDKLYTRYSYRYRNRILWGFTAEKDDGEQFFTLLSEMQQRNPGKQDFLSEVLDKVVDYQELLKQLIYFSTQTGNDFSLANVSQKILQFASAAHISKEREIEAINIFLQVSKEPFNEQPKIFVHNSLQATARLFAYFESLKNK